MGESQRACIPQDVKPSSGTYYDTLEGCLNSGCAGFMWCEFGQSVNGVRFYESEGEAYSPIPMCCSTLIKEVPQTGEYTYTESGPLNVESCLVGCPKGDTWFPLYNAFGTNTYIDDSPLAYLTRELLLQVNIGQCTVERDESRFRGLGYVKKNPYG